jgi:hypothetical protein
MYGIALAAIISIVVSVAAVPSLTILARTGCYGTVVARSSKARPAGRCQKCDRLWATHYA